MPHQYKLIYFNGRGRAEPARLILAYAGAQYNDHRIESAEWPSLKPKTPFGQLPVLDIDNGKTLIGQSISIARYLGNEFNLVPKDHIQAAKADMYVDGYIDIQKHFAAFAMEKDAAKKKELGQKFESEHLGPFLKLHEKFLNDNGTGYFVTNTVTWADLVLFNGFCELKRHMPHVFEAHPKVSQFVDKIANEPKIKAWMEKRPKTDF
jgi:glutathione S-transferase